MARSLELRRHTDNDGDVLSEEGVRAAVEIGGRLVERYDLLVSSGAQRATQSLACMMAGRGLAVRSGVVVDARFRSEHEDRWRAAFKKAGAGDLGSFLRVDKEFVTTEARLFAHALRDVLLAIPDGGRALVVGHSPMQEAAVYGLTGEIIEPLGKGAGAVVTDEGGGRYRVELLD